MARSIKKELAALLLSAAVLAPGQASASKLEVTSKADTAIKPAQSKDWKNPKKYSRDIPATCRRLVRRPWGKRATVMPVRWPGWPLT